MLSLHQIAKLHGMVFRKAAPIQLQRVTAIGENAHANDTRAKVQHEAFAKQVKKRKSLCSTPNDNQKPL